MTDDEHHARAALMGLFYDINLHTYYKGTASAVPFAALSHVPNATAYLAGSSDHSDVDADSMEFITQLELDTRFRKALDAHQHAQRRGTQDPCRAHGDEVS